MQQHKFTFRLVGTTLWLAIWLLVAACGASEGVTDEVSVLESVDVSSAEIIVTAPPEQPVEYGASLDEWSDAVAEEPLVVQQPAAEAESEPTSAEAAVEQNTADALMSAVDGPYMEIAWDALVPPDFTADAIMAKYADQLATMQDGTSEASELYSQMMEEFNNAPVNEALDGALVKLPGFIAPLSYEDETITEFLLVPYFGACIHTPPPPANQTVLVKTAPGHGININDSYNPIWILGTISAEGTTTPLAQSGYRVEDALVEPYSR